MGERCAVTSFMLLSSMILTRVFSAFWSLGMRLVPFQSAINIFGCVVLFLALLIMSSRYYYPQRNCRSLRARTGLGAYERANLIAVVVMIGFMAMGMVGGLP